MSSNTPKKTGTSTGEPKRARRKTTRPEPGLTRGRYVPLKADKDAFARGEITPRARRMNRIVDSAFNVRKRFRAAQEQHDKAVERLHERHSYDGKGFTAVSADGKRRVIVERRNTVAGNQNAVEARRLIDEYTKELLGRSTASEDDLQMASFLGAIVTESGGRILLTKSVIEFRRLRFQDDRLKQAQQLLSDAFEVRESRITMRCEERVGDEWIAR